eukprot:5584849-Prymnesium_polylepis.2
MNSHHHAIAGWLASDRTIMFALLAVTLVASDALTAAPKPRLTAAPTVRRTTGLTAAASAVPAADEPLPLRLVLAAGFACQGALQHGVATAGLNVPQAAITAELGISATSVAWSSAVSSFCLAGLFGAQTASVVADKRGRKALLALCGAICTLSGALQFASGLAAAARPGAALRLLILGRLVSGFGCGLATVGVPLYLGEIAPTALRGTFGSLNQLSICAGILLTQALAACLQAFTQAAGDPTKAMNDRVPLLPAARSAC